jgi:hypothetical protein
MPRFTGCSFFVPIAVIGIRGACQTRFRSYEELSIPTRKSAPQVNPWNAPSKNLGFQQNQGSMIFWWPK